MLKDKLITNIETASKSESVKLIRDYISIVEAGLEPQIATKRLEKIKRSLGNYILFDVLFKIALGTWIVHTSGMLVLDKAVCITFFPLIIAAVLKFGYWYTRDGLMQGLRTLNNSINVGYIFKDSKYKFY